MQYHSVGLMLWSNNRHPQNVGGKINLSDGQTKMTACGYNKDDRHSLEEVM